MPYLICTLGVLVNSQSSQAENSLNLSLTLFDNFVPISRFSYICFEVERYLTEISRFGSWITVSNISMPPTT